MSAIGRHANFKNCCLGCGALLVTMVITGFLAFNYLMMHTSMPLQAAAALLNEVPNLEVSEVSGSISEGAAVERIAYTHGDGAVSFAEGLRIKHSDISNFKEGGEFIVEEMRVKKAHLYVDSALLTDTTETESDPDTAEDSGGGVPPTPAPLTIPSRGQLARFEIQLIDIGSVIVEDRTTGWTFDLEQFNLQELVLTPDKGSIGPVTMTSNMLDIHVEPAEFVVTNNTVEHFKQQFSLTLKPAISEVIRKAISFTGGLSIEKGALQQLTASAFDGRISLEVKKEGPTPSFTLQAKKAAVSEYMEYSILDQFDGLVTMKPAAGKGVMVLEVHHGQFRLGESLFTLTPQTMRIEEANPPKSGTFQATCQKDDTTYTITLKCEDKKSPELTLQAKPAQPQMTALSTLLFNARPETLPEKKKAVLESCRAWFTPAK